MVINQKVASNNAYNFPSIAVSKCYILTGYNSRANRESNTKLVMHSEMVASYPGLLIPEFIACGTYAREGLIMCGDGSGPPVDL